MRIIARAGVAAVLIFAGIASAAGQSAAPSSNFASDCTGTNPNADQGAFSVVSIKPSDPVGRMGRVFNIAPGRLVIANLPLRQIIALAYPACFSVVGGADWIDDQHYDIQATMDGGLQKAQVIAMLGSLLRERFRLVAAADSVPGDVTNLTIASGGFHGTVAAEGERSRIALVRHGDNSKPALSYEVTATATSMDELAKWVGRELGGMAVDSTNKTGRFDFTFAFRGEGPEADSGYLTLRDALRQIGVLATSKRGSLPVLRIVSVQEPSPN